MSNARFSILQSTAVLDPRVSNSQLRTLAALGIYGDKNGWCFPKLKTLGQALNKSPQAVSRDIQALAGLGYVEIFHQHHEDGSQKHNKYRLIFDTPQRGVEPPQLDDEPPSTSEVEPPSTSEVEALTPQLTPQFNDLGGGEFTLRPNVFAVYEQEIGALTPLIRDRLIDAEETDTESWVIRAIEISAENNKRSWSYIEAILQRWRVEGYGSGYPVPKNGKSPPKNGTSPLDRSMAAIKAFEESLPDGP